MISEYDKLIKSVASEVVENIVNMVDSDNYKFAVPIGISNRHVHLSSKDVEILFGKGYELNKLKDLKQTGQYACKETVTIVSNVDGKERLIENVRILGPTRPESQVEISATDSRLLKLNPPVRSSGDLDGSSTVRLIGPKGSVDLTKGCIIATRHLHLSTIDAEKMGVTHGQIIQVKIDGTKPGVLGNVYCKVNDSYVLELHLDNDDGNAFLVKSGDYAEVLL